MPRRTWHINDRENVYLTFDDGPDPEITPWVLDFLKSKNIKASFFCVGANVVKHPDLYQRILEEGHRVGNHCMHHEKGILTNKKTYLQSVHEASTHIDSDLFRPPYGRMTMTQEKVLIKQYRIIMWSWIAYDFDRTVSIERILESAQSIKHGDILVVHDNGKFNDRTQELLPKLVKIIEAKGLRFNTL